jgi:hypothetical protein
VVVAFFAAVTVTCGSPRVEKLDPAKVDVLRASLERSDPAPTPAARATSAPGKVAPLPRTEAQRRVRAQKALRKGESLGSLSQAGKDGRFALALAVDDPKRGAMLRLFDLGSDPGVLLAAHGFGAGAVTAGVPSRLAGAYELADDRSLPLLLADLRSEDGGAALCGWWLADRPRLTCAPALSVGSTHDVQAGVVLETWPSEAPTAPVRPAGSNGRVLAFEDGDWREVDTFRCLGVPVARAVGQAGSELLGRWQRAEGQNRRTAALRAATRDQGGAAVELLRDALGFDACDVDAWRLLGRVHLQAGRGSEAVPPLAVAVALRPHGEAALVDLADALMLLRTPENASAEEAWTTAQAVLGKRKGTRDLLERAQGDRPADFASVLYQHFLSVTEGRAPQLGGQRRHAREQIERAKGP